MLYDGYDYNPTDYDSILQEYIKNIKNDDIANYGRKKVKDIVRVAEQTATELPCRFRQVQRVKIGSTSSVKPLLLRGILSKYRHIKCLGIFGMCDNGVYDPEYEEKNIVSEFEDAFLLGRSTLKELIIVADISPAYFLPAVASTCKRLTCLQLAFTDFIDDEMDVRELARPFRCLAGLSRLEYLTISDMTALGDYESNDNFCTVINRACSTISSLKSLRSHFLVNTEDADDAVVAHLAKLEVFGTVRRSFPRKLAQHKVLAKKLVCKFFEPTEEELTAFVNVLMSRAHQLESLDLQINIDDTYESVHHTVSALSRLKDHPKLKNIRFCGRCDFVYNYYGCLTELERALDGSAVKVCTSKDRNEIMPSLGEEIPFIL